MLVTRMLGARLRSSTAAVQTNTAAATRWWTRAAAFSTVSEPSASKQLVKRKVAIVAGYSGTGYHGVQLNDNVQTIEHELRQAIFDAGAMRESNFEDLSKIDWSRSSRTDKGVHAGCIVFSGKLLIDEEKHVDLATGRVKGLTEALNASLPPTIRVFSCTRVNKRFDARKNCVLREYEYFMPLSFLEKSVRAAAAANGDDDDDAIAMDEAVETFCRAVRRYEGIHDFHNFTKARSYFYKEHAKMRQRRVDRAAGTDDTEAVEDDDEVDEQVDPTAATNSSSTDDDDDGITGPSDASQFANGEETTRKSLPRHRRSIYSCSASVIHDFGGEPFVRVHIVGQAFLLNQIRCMIGGAVAVASNAMSRTMFDAALATNRIIRVPIAPAEGLILLSSSFGGKLHTVSLYADPNTVLAKERRDLSHRILLSRAEDAAMAAFRQDVLYAEVAASWRAEGDLSRWCTYLERVCESNAHVQDAELGALLAQVAQSSALQRSKRQSFVEQNREGYLTNNIKGGLLPRQFTTKLCVRFAIAPGIFTSDVRRAVTKHIKTGKLALDSTEDEILDYIARLGVDRVAEEGRKLRLSIRT